VNVVLKDSAPAVIRGELIKCTGEPQPHVVLDVEDRLWLHTADLCSLLQLERRLDLVGASCYVSSYVADRPS